MPLTVEPTRPRLCNDNRTNLDSISSLPPYVSPPLPSSPFATTIRAMTMFFFLLLVAPILAFNGAAGIL